MADGRRIAGIAAALMTLVLAAHPSGQPGLPTSCTFPDAEVAWLQRALDGWEQVSREHLRTDPTPLPWIVLYDTTCVWHLNADTSVPGSRVIDTLLTFSKRPIPVRGMTHTGTFLLPSGIPGEVEMKASTSLYRDGGAAFFTMAMPSVWQTRHVSGPARAEYLQGVFSHEMTHIRLLPMVNRRLHQLAREHDLRLPMNDDVIQTEFRAANGFEAAINREREQLFRAVAEPARRTALTRRALELARERRGRFFTGANAPYAEIESLFLMLEGVGQWSAYRLARERVGSEAEAIRLIRADRRFWSQDQGLALFILIDALVPGWQSRIFADTPASPFALLDEGLADGAAKTR